MPRTDLDPRTGGACIKCIASKLVSICVGWLQLIIFVIAFFTLVFSPSSVSNVVSADTWALVVGGFLLLLCNLFIVGLLIGIHKDKKLYIKIYCIFMGIYCILIALSIVVNIFLQPSKMGFRGFFSMIFSLILNLVFLFVARSYYLVTYCNNSNQMISNQPKV